MPEEVANSGEMVISIEESSWYSLIRVRTMACFVP